VVERLDGPERLAQQKPQIVQDGNSLRSRESSNWQQCQAPLENASSGRAFAYKRKSSFLM
jgi:hypothetical protein